MKVSEVKFARKFNEGNYESKDYSITAVLDEDDVVAEVFKELDKEITAAHSGETTEGEEENANEGNTTRGLGKTARKDPKDDSGEDENEKEEESGEEVGKGTDELEEMENEAEEETPKKPVKPAAAKPAAEKAGKKFKVKAQVYQRGNDAHKEIFSGILKEVAPNWKKDDKSKAKAKTASTELEGEDFLDAEGEVLATFKQSVKKFMGAKK